MIISAIRHFKFIRSFDLGWGWGDPHYGPFDDIDKSQSNTFRSPGLNYYNILKIVKSGSVVFTMQALISGLLIKSMAIGLQGIESYQVVINIQQCY